MRIGGRFSTDFIRTLLVDRHKKIWLATDGAGLSIFDRKNEQFHRFHLDPLTNHGLQTSVPGMCLEDRSGNIWLGSYGSGIQLVPAANQVKHFPPFRGKGAGLGGLFVKTMSESNDGKIWIGFDYAAGLHRFDPKTENFEVFRHESGNPNSIPGDKIWDVYEDFQGWVWMAASPPDGGSFQLYKFKPDSKQAKSYPGSPERIYEDSQNRIWVEFNDRKGQNYISLYDELNDSFQKICSACSQIREDREGNLLVIHERGIGRISMSGGPVETSLSLAGLEGWPCSAWIQDHKGRFWIMANELVCIDPANDTVHKLRLGENIPQSWSKELLEDNAGNIWVYTVEGIFKRATAE